MGDVAATMKIMPESPEVDLDDLEETLAASLPAGATIRGVERENVAFGLVALIASVLVDDDAGGTEAVEAAFSDLPNVESVSVEAVGRV